MAANLLISYPDIPFRAKTFSSLLNGVATEGDEDNREFNQITGPRNTFFKFGSTSGNSATRSDLGTGNTSAVDHVIIARADLLQTAAVTTLDINRSTDATTYNNEFSQATFNSQTLLGPRSHDFIKTVTLTTAYRAWEIKFTSSGTPDFAHSKAYLGAFFDFGKDPDQYTQNLIPPRQGQFTSTAGDTYATRLQEPVYQFRFIWEGISDALTTSFFDKIARYSSMNPVFLYTLAAGDKLLDEKRLVHCGVTDISTEHVFNDWNIIDATFTELIG